MLKKILPTDLPEPVPAREVADTLPLPDLAPAPAFGSFEWVLDHLGGSRG